MYDLERSIFKNEPNPTDDIVDDSRQLAPFMHGDDLHSFMSVSQLNPTYPASQVHAYSPNLTCLDLIVEVESVQTPLFIHGKDEHSFVSTPQFIPVNPTTHLHEYLLMAWLQVAAFLHGDDAHSSTFVSQLYPEKPGTQRH
jgi:hypothetical protein